MPIGDNLPIPEEPNKIKRLIMDIRRSLSNNPDINYDALAVWYLNEIPKYLWREWKDHLTNHGYNWQRFLRVLKLHTNDMIMWALRDQLSWDEMINKIIDTLGTYARR